jgi:intein-encoded DNA endonuclease-like protein
MNRFIATPQQELEITQRYMNGESSHKLASEFNTHHGTIADIVRRNNGSMRMNKDSNRLYSLDEHIFDVCNTEEKAYWLGFIYADGTINRQRTVILDIAEKDKEHLEKFKSFMKIKNPIRPGEIILNGKSHKHNAVYVTSQHMGKVLLEKYGMTPNNKSINGLENIPEELRIHWIRGFYDGDGCTMSRKISFLGQLEEIDFIINFFNLPSSRYKYQRGNMYYWYATGKFADIILHKMYDNCSVCLERKRERKSRS